MPLALATILILMIVPIGCTKAAPVPHDPSAVGVIQSLEFVKNGLARVTLARGALIEIDFNAARNLYGGGGGAGDLLIYGSDGNGPWYVELAPVGDHFEISSQPATDSEGGLIFDFGLRLPLAPNYHDAGHGFEAGAPSTYEVNEKGEVTERR